MTILADHLETAWLMRDVAPFVATLADGENARKAGVVIAKIFHVDYTTERKREAKAGLPRIDYCPVCGRKAQVTRITDKDGRRRTIFTHSETGRLFAGMVFWSNRDWHVVKGEK